MGSGPFDRGHDNPSYLGPPVPVTAPPPRGPLGKAVDWTFAWRTRRTWWGRTLHLLVAFALSWSVVMIFVAGILLLGIWVWTATA